MQAPLGEFLHIMLEVISYYFYLSSIIEVGAAIEMLMATGFCFVPAETHS